MQSSHLIRIDPMSAVRRERKLKEGRCTDASLLGFPQ
jgi:hypothetical protein